VLAIVLNITWQLLKIVWPLVVALAAVAIGWTVWNGRRWR
jgi:hypothetical protein